MLRAYYFTSLGALGLYQPFFPPWLEARGIEGLAMGALAATLPALSLVGPPLFGALADAIGKPSSVLRVASLGTFATFAVIACTAALGRNLAYVELFGIILLFALFRSPTTSLTDSIALDLAKNGVSSYGRLRLWGSLGFLAGVAAGGRFIDARALAPLPIAVAIGYLTAALTSFALPSGAKLPSRPFGSDIRRVFANADLRFACLVAFVAQFANSAYDLCYFLHVRDRAMPSTWIGPALAIGVISEILLMAAPIDLRGRAPAALALALGAGALRWTLIAVFHSPVALLVVQPFHALTFGLFWIASLELVKTHAPEGTLGTAQGFFSATTALGTAIGLLVFGPLYRSAGGGVTFGVAAAIAGLGCGIAVYARYATREAEGVRERAG
jgi:PPP family 3-phenylpropionic acid transporter